MREPRPSSSAGEGGEASLPVLMPEAEDGLYPSRPENDEGGAHDLGMKSAAGALTTIFSQTARFAIQFGSLVVLGRLLKPWQFGIIAMINPVVAFLYVFADLGLAQAVVQRPRLLPVEVSSVHWVVCLTTLALATIAGLAAPLAAAGFHEPRIAAVLIALVPVMAFSSLAIIPRALLTRHAEFRKLALIDVAAALAGAGATVASALAGAGYWALVFGQVSGIGLATVLCIALCGWRPQWRLKWSAARPLVGAGGYVAGANLGNLLITGIDNVVIGSTIGKAGLGLYDQGYRLVFQSVSQLVNPVSRAMTPLLIRASQQRQPYATAFLGALRLQLLVLWPGLVVAGVFAHEVVQLAVGEQWLGAAPALAWFCFGAMATPVFSATAWLFVAEGRFRAYSWTSLAGSAAVLLAVLLGLGGGVTAVARNVSSCYAVIVSPALCLVATRRGDVRAGAILRAIWPYFLGAVLVATLLFFARAHANIAGPGAFVGSLVGSYLVFLAIALVSPSNRKMLLTGIAWRSSLLRLIRT